MTVHHIYMDAVGSAAFYGADFVAEPRKVRRQDRWGNVGHLESLRNKAHGMQPVGFREFVHCSV
jgi:hypothetical protein